MKEKRNKNKIDSKQESGEKYSLKSLVKNSEIEN